MMESLLRNADELTRRRFVANAAKTFLGVGLIPAGLQTRVLGATPTTRPGVARNVIYLYMSGGMTHLDTFDPKPGAKTQGPVKAIGTRADGVQVSEFFPTLAGQMDKVAVINSVSSTQGAHEQGNYIMHTSYPMRGTIRHPSMGAWLAKMSGRTNDTIPANVIIGGASRNAGAGFFESKYAPVYVGSPTSGLQNSKIRGVTREEFDSRLTLAQELDKEFVSKYNQKQVRAFTDMYGDALKLMDSEDLKAFEIDKEPASLRQAYGDNSFGQGCLLARRLVEHHVRFVEVTLGGWDTHNNNFVSVPERAATLDQALGTLLEDLGRRGMLDDTLVVLATEFGRTPNINQNAGRDHYPAAFSCLLAGAGVKQGIKYGKTDEMGARVIENKVTVPDFNATIAYALGLPIDKVIHSPSGRPFTVAHKGKPVFDVIA